MRLKIKLGSQVFLDRSAASLGGCKSSPANKTFEPWKTGPNGANECFSKVQTSKFSR